MVIKKPFIVTKSLPKKSAHDFTLSRDEWEQAVFDNAAYFRINAFVNNLRYDDEVTSFREAVSRAQRVLDEIEGSRVIIYAITAGGRAVLIPKEKWND